MDEGQLREVLGGEPAKLIREKIADRLNSLTRQFVERSHSFEASTRSRSCLRMSLRR